MGANGLLPGILCLAEHCVDGLARGVGLHGHWGVARARMALGGHAAMPDCCPHDDDDESYGERAHPSQDQRPGSWGLGDGANLRSRGEQARARGVRNVNLPWVKEKPAEDPTGTVFYRYMSVKALK